MSDRLAIACGNKLGPPNASLVSVARALARDLEIDTTSYKGSPYETWNELVDAAEKRISREDLCKRLLTLCSEPEDAQWSYPVAGVPVSNLIDTTLHRQLAGSLRALGREPIEHDWLSQRLGSWQRSDPVHPHLFYMLPDLQRSDWVIGIHDETRRTPQNTIQIENMREMLTGRDLLLLGMDFDEAEDLLHLGLIGTACDKIVTTIEEIGAAAWWAERGVYAAGFSVDDVVKGLQPSTGQTYSTQDILFPGRTLIDLGRDKTYDAFISYFSGDAEFVAGLDQGLRIRGIKTWRDSREIDVGDSISSKIEEGLKNSYSLVIVLTPESLARPMVMEELRAGYAMRLGGKFKILPVLTRDCELPALLGDYRYADFREPKRHGEQLDVLAHAIQNASRAARNK